MLNYDEELKKFKPILDVDEVENVIYGRDLMDAIDLIKEMKSLETKIKKGTADGYDAERFQELTEYEKEFHNYIFVGRVGSFVPIEPGYGGGELVRKQEFLEETDAESGSAVIGIGTLESYLKLRSYYGAERMLPVYIEVDDGTRLQRALDREKQQKNPNYAELCRRFLADQQDFSEEKLKEAGIRKRYQNDALPDCLARIAEDVIHYV